MAAAGDRVPPPPADPQPRPVIACYRPKPGQEEALAQLVRDHVPALRRFGLATERGQFAMRAGDGTVVEVFEWASAAAIVAAHQHPGVHRMWDAFASVCDYVRLSDLAEAQEMFAEFAPLPR